MKQRSSAMTATKLRVILVVCLFAITLLAAGVFYIGHRQLTTMATDVSHAIGEANASQNTLASLQQTERDLKANQDTVDRAQQVVADSQNYTYQNTIITDLQTYASRAGLTINTIDFSGGDTNSGTSAAPATTTPTAPASGATTTTGSLKTTKVTVTLKNPVNYDNLLHFLRSIEQNLTKLQIANVGLSKATDANTVTTNSLSIELYTK